jgi:hypothetical protein
MWVSWKISVIYYFKTIYLSLYSVIIFKHNPLYFEHVESPGSVFVPACTMSKQYSQHNEASFQSNYLIFVFICEHISCFCRPILWWRVVSSAVKLLITGHFYCFLRIFFYESLLIIASCLIFALFLGSNISSQGFSNTGTEITKGLYSS